MKRRYGQAQTSWGVLTIITATTLSVGGLLPTPGAFAKINSPGMWTARCGTSGGLECMLEGREGAAGSVIDNEIIITHGLTSAGDSNDTRIYDIGTNTWSDPAPVPSPVARRSELAGAAHGDLVYAVGGRSTDSSCADMTGFLCKDLEVYDRVANAWASLPPMPTARAGLAAAVVGDKLYAIGGRTGTDSVPGWVPGSGQAVDCLEAYDIAAGTWSPACGTPGALAAMPAAAMDVAAVAMGGKIYVIGGASGPDTPSAVPLVSTVQIYDVAHNSWSLGTSMPTARANLALTTCGSVILALGGRTGPASFGTLVNSATVEAYQISKDAWITGLTPMPTAKSEHAAVSHGGTVYAVGSGIYGVHLNQFEALSCSSLFGK